MKNFLNDTIEFISAIIASAGLRGIKTAGRRGKEGAKMGVIFFLTHDNAERRKNINKPEKDREEKDLTVTYILTPFRAS